MRAGKGKAGHTYGPGEWCQPRRKGFFMQCCGCGLVHRMNFRILTNGRGSFIQFQAFQSTRKEMQAARRTQEKKHDERRKT